MNPATAPGKREVRTYLVKYWERFGDTIGHHTIPLAAPLNLNGIEVRATHIPPAVIMAWPSFLRI